VPEPESSVTQGSEGPPASYPRLVGRGLVGGALMGLANLVPGISGGTMLLAAGVYPRFIRAVGEVTRLKFRKPSLALLGAVVAAAVLAIALAAGPIKDLVVHHRWVMYSIFIGLTLGGVPILWRLLGKINLRITLAIVAGVLAMAVLAFTSAGGGGMGEAGVVMMFLAGLAGASAMILPGVSGGYLLLVLGVYVPLLAGIEGFVEALKTGDMATVVSLTLSLILPVGLGVVVGVAGVSNLLEWFLERFEKATLGFLLGLLLGAVLGLWPFQQGVAPDPGDTVKGQTVIVAEGGDLVYDGTGKTVEPDDWPTDYFAPGVTHVFGALVLILVSFGVTTGIDRFGREP
jgi:putative membrane protein